MKDRVISLPGSRSFAAFLFVVGENSLLQQRQLPGRW